MVKGRHDMIVHSWYYRPLPITYVCDMHILYICEPISSKLHTDVVVCRLRVVKGRHDMIVRSWYCRPLPITYVCVTNFVQITHTDVNMSGLAGLFVNIE